MHDCYHLSGSAHIFSIVGGIELSVHNSFGGESVQGVIVGKFVGRRDSNSAAAMIGPTSFPWDDTEYMPSLRGMKLQDVNRQDQYSGSAGSSSRQQGSNSNNNKNNEPTYYVNAILTYPRVDEMNNTYFHNCSMSVASYEKKLKAYSGLKKVRLGKVVEVKVSKKHHGKYCIEEDEWKEHYQVGFGLLVALGAWLGFAILFCCVMAALEGAKVASDPHGGVVQSYGVQTAPSSYAQVGNSGCHPVPAPCVSLNSDMNAWQSPAAHPVHTQCHGTHYGHYGHHGHQGHQDRQGHYGHHEHCGHYGGPNHCSQPAPTVGSWLSAIGAPQHGASAYPVAGVELVSLPQGGFPAVPALDTPGGGMGSSLAAVVGPHAHLDHLSSVAERATHTSALAAAGVVGAVGSVVSATPAVASTAVGGAMAAAGHASHLAAAGATTVSGACDSGWAARTATQAQHNATRHVGAASSTVGGALRSVSTNPARHVAHVGRIGGHVGNIGRVHVGGVGKIGNIGNLGKIGKIGRF